ncbi:hypothetical protein [Microcoleus phage My-WqHQDG]|nr:hypothetical protein [Microcoleus phage My-WqHQDG]
MPQGLQIQPNGPYNFGPYISPWITTGTTEAEWGRVFTELAESYIPIVSNTPLTELFPIETIDAQTVVVRQTMEPDHTIFPIVLPCKPDVLVGPNYGRERMFYVQPLFIRQSTSLCYGEINNRVRNCNDPYPTGEQIQKMISLMVMEHNLTWDVFRARMLLGGIRYTDPRTGVFTDVASNIPAYNLFSYNVTAGIGGRNESKVFRTYEDTNSLSAVNAGTSWADPNADFVYTIQSIKQWFKATHKSNLTAMYMSPEMRSVLSTSNIVNWMSGVRIIESSSSSPYSQFIQLGNDGLVTAIAGLEVREVDTQFIDPVDGVNKRVWPKNKVVFISGQSPTGEAQAIGRTQFCIGESPDGKPGIWSRTNMETHIPAAPGMYLQMGNAGMPYLTYPYRVVHVNVATLEDINNRLALQGDLNFMP